MAYNLGNGLGTSVREIIQASEKVTGCRILVVVGKRRSGDPPMLVGDARRAMLEMGWQPRVSDIQTNLSSAWHWEQARFRGKVPTEPLVTHGRTGAASRRKLFLS